MAKLTPEVKAELSRPFPKEVIKSFQGKGGKTMRYIDVDVLEQRIESVDPDYEKDVAFGENGVTVHYTILGVRRGDGYDNDDESNKYGAPQVNALARASRRAARMFGVGAQLWEEADDEDAPRASYPKQNKPAGKQASGKVSDKQAEQLRGLGIPDATIANITFTQAKGVNYGGEGLIDALYEAKKESGGKKLTPAAAKLVLRGYGVKWVDDADDYDEEDDE